MPKPRADLSAPVHGPRRCPPPRAFKLAERYRWIGWSTEPQFPRLHLITDNSCFVIPTPERVPQPRLASAGADLEATDLDDPPRHETVKRRTAASSAAAAP